VPQDSVRLRVFRDSFSTGPSVFVSLRRDKLGLGKLFWTVYPRRCLGLFSVSLAGFQFVFIRI
jgi:hypothetical protein